MVYIFYTFPYAQLPTMSPNIAGTVKLLLHRPIVKSSWEDELNLGPTSADTTKNREVSMMAFKSPSDAEASQVFSNFPITKPRTSESVNLARATPSM